MIPILILAGIDVVLGVWAGVLLVQRDLARSQRDIYRAAGNDALDGWRSLIAWIKRHNSEAAAERSARARHARACQIEQQRQRKAATTAKLRGGK